MSDKNSNLQLIRNGPIQPSGSGIGYLMVGLMAFFLIGANAYGFDRATGLPSLIGLAVAILAFAIRMYLLRRRSPQERFMSSGLDRTLFYLPPALLSTGLSAFAIYCFFVLDSEARPKERPAGERLEQAVMVIENYYHEVRAKISSRLETNDERLRELDAAPPSQQRQAVVADLEEEQRMLRGLLRQIATAIRLPASKAPSPDYSPDGAGSIDEGSVHDDLSRKFEAAVRLHQQLPDFVRRDVEAPLLESLSEGATSGGKLERFFRDLMALTDGVKGCLAVPVILELFIVILVISNRPRY
jgi:hypothetical protein